MRVAAVQTTAGSDRTENLAGARDLVERAADAGATLVVLPEYFSVAGSPSHLRRHAEPLDGPTVTWARDLAGRLGITLVAGTFPEADPPLPDAGTRLANTCCTVGPDGEVRAVYRKIHLFDVDLGTTTVTESATIAPGDRVVTVDLEGTGPAPGAGAGAGISYRLGLSVCYDLRFPELYRALALAGSQLVVVPAAFTAATGPAHWELLLRARAVEDQVVVIGAGQVGTLPAGMPPCHGHSMVVDPWGTVVAERADPSPGIVVTDVDLGQVAEVRRRLPVLAHRRPGAYR